MKMNVFEYTITDGNFDIAGCDDLELAKEIANMLAVEKHCNIDVINAFTGEVSYSLESFIHITLDAYGNEVSKIYETKVREW
jgi:hypothetical protein